MKLTAEQFSILRHTIGKALVTAGAGCGKTTVLIEYIVRILLGHTFENILVLTFSNSACEELKTRLCQRLQVNDLTGYKNLTITTYDAFGYSVVRKHYQKLGCQKVPKPIENTELIKECVAEVVKFHLKQEDAYNKISELELKKVKKSMEKELAREMMVHNKLLASGQRTTKSIQKNSLVKKVLELYKQKKKNQNLLDFDDMVGQLIKNRQALKEAAQEYRYLLVDELQDTSVKQTKMLIALAKNIETTVMVGDPKQNINGFRGAFSKNWDTIKAELKPREYQLTKSQRIPAPSLSFVNAIGDEIYPGARLVSDVEGLPVRLVYCETIAEQAQYIAERINWLIEVKGVRTDEIACLGRTRRSLSDLTVALEGHGIVTQELYRVSDNKHTKSLRNLLRLARSLRQFPIEKGFEFPKKRRKAFTSVLKRLGVDDQEIDHIYKKMPRIGWKAVGVISTIKGKNRHKANPKYRPILAFRELIAQAVKAEEPEKAISYLMDALRKVLSKDNDRRTLGYLMRDLTQLKIKIRQFASWNDLNVKKLQLNNDLDGVQLSTINGAKGKEWSYVFVIHCVEGFIPIHYAKTDQELDSEKMLLYVAITRHKKGLYLMDSPGSMVIYNGGKNKKSREDAPFLDCSPFIKPHEKHLKVLDAV